jgi:signal transduction histidine kinase
MTRRLLAANTIVIAVVLLVLEVPLAVVFSRHEHDALNAALQRDASTVAALAGDVLTEPEGQNAAAIARRFPSTRGVVVVIVDRSGRELTAPGILSGQAALATALGTARAGQPGVGEIGGLTYAAVPIGDDGAQGAVLVAQSDEAVDARVHRFWTLLAGVGAGAVVLCVAVGWWLSRWVVQPLRELQLHALAVGDGELSTRVGTDRGPPEVTSLSATFNDMAERLDNLLASHRRFVADASHQLRTPLTALRLRLENLDPDEPGSVAATREAALQEVDRLTRLVDGLLCLAKAEGGRPERGAVDVAAVLRDRHDAWAPLASEHDVALVLALDSRPLRALLVPGDLEQVVDNLIDNALGATDPGHSVTLAAHRENGSIEIHVIDDGRGMSDVDRAHAFDPFWRGADTAWSDGTGLGLAIAAQLTRASRGTLTLERSKSGGIDAAVRVPADGTS